MSAPSTPTSSLLAPLRLGAIELKNSIVMAPLTRSRANPMAVPSDLAVEYYGQRAGAGLIVTEATQVSDEAMGYARTPGVHTAEQVAVWSKVAKAVHDRGGKIVMQLWHVGRIAHPLNRGFTADIVAPSAIAAPGQMWTDQSGMQPFPVPRALATDEIAGIAADFATAAENALAAGFDGVEIHSANGYLLHQFLSTNANQRTDRYGGSIENRIRMPLEIVEAVLAKVPADRVGIRVSPGHTFNGIEEADRDALYAAYLARLNEYGLAYLHVMRPTANAYTSDPVTMARKHWTGRLVAAGGYTPETGAALVASGGADAVAFGQNYIANPDLAKRIETGAPLNSPDPSTFYTPGPVGYIDYPVLAA
ncbi:MAG: alkene reductase [Hyphomicrobium sp.]|nr:alkene reductase [Hyphomicrobium sp.]